MKNFFLFILFICLFDGITWATTQSWIPKKVNKINLDIIKEDPMIETTDDIIFSITFSNNKMIRRRK